MPRGTRIKAAEMRDRLAALDVDEGIRIEKAGIKTFVNRKASRIFVVQFGDDFQYLDSAKDVTNLIKSRCGTKYSAWAY